MKIRFFKKTLSVLMAVIITAGIVIMPVCVSARDTSVKFSVGTDLHIINPPAQLEINYPENELYFQTSGSGNLYDQAADLTKQFLYGSAEEGASFILIPGDLTRNGTEIQHRYTADLLAEFENETGIQVYVVPGNHDYFRSMPDDFKEYYSSFGYDTALETHEQTASYTADVADGYRLIAVDSNTPGEGGDGIDDSLLEWISTQADNALKDGKRIIYMMHHPLLEHLFMGKILMKNFIVRESNRISELFTRLGIEYVFTGHEHGNDIADFTGTNGKKVYDILTTSLSSYPLEYRSITMSEEGADISMRKIETCNTSDLVPGYTAAQKDLLENDYDQFAYGMFKFAAEKKLQNYISPDFLKKKLKVENETLSQEIDLLCPAVSEALSMPLYDPGDGNQSIEALAKAKGVVIPESSYTSLFDLASAVIAAHYYGDENLPAGQAPEAEIFIKGLNTGLQYVLDRTGREGLDILLKAAEISFPADTVELSQWFNAVALGREDSYKIAQTILYPAADKYLTDFSVADRDIFLASQTESRPGIINYIISFLRKISDLIMKVIRNAFN